MRKTIIFLAFLFSVAYNYTTTAQVITANPALPTASDAVVITFDATQGNGNLAGYSGDVYAHTGVKIEGNDSWQYVIGTWGNNTTQPKLTRLSTNTYQLQITPSIREYYGVPSDKKIVKLCFVFRASSGSPQSEDLFIDVVEAGLNVKVVTPTSTYPFKDYGSTVSIEAQSNFSETLSLFVNNVEVASTDEFLISYDHVVDSYGKQWIKAIATSGSDWVADSVYFYVRGTVPVADLPQGLVPGINFTGSNEVTLVLHDPPALKEYVFVLGDFNNWELDDEFYMNRTNDGKHYWKTLGGLNPNQEYIFQYWIDGEIKIADPYSEKLSDPWNDKWISSTTYPNLIPYPDGKTTGIASVFKINQDEYQWEMVNFSPPAKEDLIIYELHIRDFVDDDYIVTTMQKLDYLKTLGVNAIELMPINEFEGNDSWGYNPSFYFATDKAYGTKNDYKKFIDECHKRGMAVIIDMVLNHSFGQSPLVQMYFNPNAGEWGQPTATNPWYNQTCPHPPYCWGYDFDHTSQYTKDFIDRVAEFWLTEFKVDGFRFDFTKGFTNVLTGGEGWNYNSQRIAILKRYADFIWSVNPNAYVILEHFTDNTEEKELAEYKSNEGKGMLIWGNMNHTYNEASMGWLSSSNFGSVSYKQRNWSVPHLIGYMESHDEERLMYKNLTYGNSTNADYDIKKLRYALDRQHLVGAFFFTVPGPKMIWQFGELGYDYSIDYNGRVGRKPVRWDYYNVSQRRNLYYCWAELIALRKSLPVFRTDDFTLSVSGAEKKIFLRHSSMDVVIVGNFGVTEQNISVDFPNSGKWYEYLSQTEHSFTTTSQTFSMRPSEYRIYSTSYINREQFIVGVNMENFSQSKLSITVSPNPFSTELQLSVITDKKEKFSAQLLDINGKQIADIINGVLYPGSNEFTWERPSGLPKGLYILRVITVSDSKAIKLIVN